MKRSRNSLLHGDPDVEPMASAANLFDVAMVFAVALMVALTARFNMTEFLSGEDFTVVKNPGKADMEIITREAGEVKRYSPDDESLKEGRLGRRVGSAYELDNGEIVYIPE